MEALGAIDDLLHNNVSSQIESTYRCIGGLKGELKESRNKLEIQNDILDVMT